MNTPGPQKTTEPVDGDEAVPDDTDVAAPSIWDTLGDEDRASIERGLAQSLAGLYATDEEVEAAWAAFGP